MLLEYKSTNRILHEVISFSSLSEQVGSLGYWYKKILQCAANIYKQYALGINSCPHRVYWSAHGFLDGSYSINFQKIFNCVKVLMFDAMRFVMEKS